MKLQNIANIINNKILIHKKHTGIYFLIKDNEIVYIGKSCNIYNRIGKHNNNLDFNNFSFIKCETENLDKLESAYIDKYKPKYNIKGLNNISKKPSIKKSTNNLQKLTEGMKFAYILKKYNKLIPEIYSELKGKSYKKMTKYRLENLLDFSDDELKQEISVVELEIFCKMLRIEPKELLK